MGTGLGLVIFSVVAMTIIGGGINFKQMILDFKSLGE